MFFLKIEMFCNYSLLMIILKITSVKLELQNFCNNKQFIESHRTMIFCSNFTSFDELNLSLIEINASITSVFLNLRPLNSLTLNNSLNLSHFNKQHVNNLKISMKNINSIDSTSSVFSVFKNASIISSISFYDAESGNISFTYSKNSTTSIFSNLNLSTITFHNINFLNTMPAITFKNSFIELLLFHSCSFSRNDVISSYYNKEDSSGNYNISIKRLTVLNSTHGFNFEIFPPQIYSNVKELTVLNTKILIGKRFSAYFSNLKYFDVSYSLGNEENETNYWMTYLNYGKYFNFYDKNAIINASDVLVLRINETFNYLLDKYFCMFTYFPHNQLVIPYLDSQENIQCTCTVYWLFKYHREYLKFVQYFDEFTNYVIEVNDDNFYDCLNAPDYELRVSKCNFDEKKLICAAKSNKIFDFALLIHDALRLFFNYLKKIRQFFNLF